MRIPTITPPAAGRSVALMALCLGGLAGCSNNDATMNDASTTPIVTSTSAYAAYQGGWQRVQNGTTHYLGIRGDRCVESSGTHQTLSFLTMRNAKIFRTMAYSMDAIQESMRIEGDELVIDLATPPPGSPGALVYQRMPRIPEAADPTPFRLGTRQPTAEESTAIADDLARRMKAEQDVRVEYQQVMQAAQERLAGSSIDPNAIMRDPDVQDVVSRMVGIDAENTRHLITLMKDVGWIDSDRFGQDANQGAFLIVQHSGNLSLMQTALPLIREALEEHPELGQHYALLYDRMKLALGGKQRYGTQLSGTPAGMRLSRLEDPEKVEAYRAEIGIGSLEDYIRQIEEAYNATVIRE